MILEKTMYYANTFYVYMFFLSISIIVLSFLRFILYLLNGIYMSNSFLFSGAFSATSRTTATFSLDSFKEFILIF